MAAALLVSSGGTVWSGLISRARAYNRNERDFGSKEEDAGEEFWKETHELLADLTLLLVGVHIAAVLFSCYLHGAGPAT
jgi:cytochrome b